MRHLDFDSQLFGFEVYRAEVVPPEKDMLRADLLYIFTYKDIPEDTLDRWNGQLVDRKRTYQCVLSSRPILPVEKSDSLACYPHLERELSETDRENLFELAYLSGIHSRFKNDRHLPQPLFEKMYRTWMINSISRKLAYAIMLAVFREKIVGMMTLEGKESATNLGLVAISEEMQGKGVGKNLMNATFRYIADEKKHDVVTTVTHGQDERACRFYEKMGFELMDEIKVYHIWPRGPRA